MSPATTEFQDHSGFASLEELDPLSADHLAKQPWRKELLPTEATKLGNQRKIFGQPTGTNKSDDEFSQELFFHPFLLGRNDLV